MGFIEKVGRAFRREGPWSGAEAVLDRMEALAGAGRCLDAVAYGSREARRLDDLRVDRRLTTLRREAVREAVRAATPRVDWPPRLPDPFPGTTGLPEIRRDALDAATMGGAILHHGSLLVRRLLDREEAVGIAREIDGVYDAHDRRRSGVDEADGGRLSPFPLDLSDPLWMTRDWLRSVGGILAVDCPAIFTRLVRFYERHGLIAAIEGYLGERPLMTVGKTVLRRVEPVGIGDFHQDGSFLGADARTINVWIALSDCGVDAPGLEVVDRRLASVLPSGGGDARYPWAVDRETARRANDGRPFAVPVFRAGDALLFDQMMLHATGFAPGMARRRHALEAWFFAPSAHPEDQIGLVI